MKKLLEDLLKLISNQEDEYHKLLAILQDESRIIAASAIDDLNCNNKQKEVIILQIKLLEEACEKILTTIFSRLPHSGSPPGIPALIGYLKEPYGAMLAGCYNSLLAVARAVKECNSTNERLIKGSLRVVRGSISFLVACASAGSPTYENNGLLPTAVMSRQMIREEA